MMLEKGTLWQQVVRVSEAALRSGALLPVPTEHAFLDDGGIRFFVRVLASLQRKDEARKKQDAEAKAGKAANPFLPPEPELTVSGVTDTHLAILNKFNVVERHLLIVTRRFEDQDTLLTVQDFEALRLCMDEYPSLGFYNGGRDAGASQQHKHLQMVPLPLAPEGPAVPITPLLPQTAEYALTTVPAFPFLHSFVRLGQGAAHSPLAAAGTAFRLYGEMLERTGINRPAASGLTLQSGPYCFLATREWMLVIPRSREFLDAISFNSLAFAGSLFVRNREQLEHLRTFGPFNALRRVARGR